MYVLWGCNSNSWCLLEARDELVLNRWGLLVLYLPYLVYWASVRWMSVVWC